MWVDRIELEANAHMLNQMVIDSFLRCVRTGQIDVLSAPIKAFKQYYDDVPFTSVINLCMYERWYGNFCSVINTIVFTPRLYTELYDIDHYSYVLTEAQICDVFNTTFRLIIDDGLKTHGFLDYYDNTVSMMVTCSYDDNMPPQIASAVRRFKWLYSMGDKIVNIQQKYVRDWLQRKRLKALVLKIEDIWLPILACPNTRPGNRLLQRKIARWIAEDQLISS